ncbi:MAG: hypothetical protein WCH37_02195 [Synechococcaceae cyanobacterium ELA182]
MAKDPMMGYVSDLNPIELQIHAMVTCKAWIIEDGPMCRKHDIFDYFDARHEKMTNWNRPGRLICAKSSGLRFNAD